MPDDEDYKPIGGGLRLKGVQGGKVEKKKKKKKRAKVEGGEVGALTKREDAEAGGNGSAGEEEEGRGRKVKESEIVVGKTEAEKRFEEMREKRLLEKLKREGIKSHKERVEEFNKYLSSLSEHHDMPRIGPG